MPEMNSASVASFKSALGTLMSNPTETAQVIQANFPGVQVRQDDRGNYILRSSQDGQEYAIKPGFQVSDIPRALGAVAAFTPAGRARSIAGAATGAAGTQAVIEGTQAATGGNFNPGDVALAGVAGGAVPAIARAGGALWDAGRAALSRGRAAPPAEAAMPGSGAAPNIQSSGAAPGPSAPTSSGPVSRTAPTSAAGQVAAAPVRPAAADTFASLGAAQMKSADLAQTARKAAEGGIGSRRATQVLAEQAAPDQKALDAAKRLGIEDHLQPDHVTTSQAYRELSQAVKSIPGSEARAAELQGYEAVGQRAERLIEELGGSSDVSTLNTRVKQQLQQTQLELSARAEKLYSEVNRAIPAKTEAPATSLLNFLRQHADEMGGAQRLMPAEQKLLKALDGSDGPVTYAFLDQTRQQVGRALHEVTGPFKDSNSGILSRLYGHLADDQLAVAERAGAAEVYKAAQATVATRKGVEDDLVALFGKALDDSLVGDLHGAVRVLAQGDTSSFLRLVKRVPEAQRKELTASGLAAAFRTASTRGPINFTTYAKWYEGLLKNKQAHAALMSNLPAEGRKGLSDLYRVSRGISAASRERITTGRINAVTEELKGPDNLASRLYEVATRNAPAAAVGAAASTVLPGGVAGAIAGALSRGGKSQAVKAADALISSPEFLNLARTGGDQAAKVRALARSNAFSRYVKAVGSPRDMSDRERWVMQVVQGRINTQE
jgi:hypothetical protein